jgi:WD40 repeat protein
VSSSADLSLRLWQHQPASASAGADADFSGDWQELASLPGLHTFPGYSVSWNGDAEVKCHDTVGSSGGTTAGGGLVASGGGDNDIHIVHVSEDEAGSPMMRRVQSIKGAHAGDVNCVRWGPCRAEQSETDVYLAKVDAEGHIGAAAHGGDYLPTSHILASAGDDGTAKLWKLVM